MSEHNHDHHHGDNNQDHCEAPNLIEAPKKRFKPATIGMIGSVVVGSIQLVVNRLTRSPANYSEALHNLIFDGGLYAAVGSTQFIWRKGGERARKAVLLAAGAVSIAAAGLSIKEAVDERFRDDVPENVRNAALVSAALSLPVNLYIKRRFGHYHIGEDIHDHDTHNHEHPEEEHDAHNTGLFHAIGDVAGSCISVGGALATAFGAPGIVESVAAMGSTGTGVAITGWGLGKDWQKKSK